MKGRFRARWWLSAWLLGVVVHAQPQLAVNGVAVPGATATLVAGVAYAPAVDLAGALGADLHVDPFAGRATFTLGAAIVQVAMVADAGLATAVDPALRRDGDPRPGPAAVYDGIEAYVPVKGVIEAFGGRVAYLEATQTVVAVLPRPRLEARVEGGGSAERLVLRLDAPTRVVQGWRAATGVLELRFERTDAVPTALEGGAFVRAVVEPVRGSVEVRVQLLPDRAARVWTLPDGSGTAVVVAFANAADPIDPVAAQGKRLVLDAGPRPDGGDDAAARGFVDAIAAALSGSGIDVVRTRPSPAPVALADRAAAGAGADALLSVVAADVPAGQARLYVLDDASEASVLDTALRRNAEDALASPTTDAVRRAVLLRLVPDLDAGRRLAAALRTALATAGLASDPALGAPLAVLDGAAGRGVLLELAPDDLLDPDLPTSLAAALARWLADPLP